ncbi:YdeI/OmpD-associated family protein [Tsuneonella sp. YG55]|uniref:YdeI/OmpD-associated family protein n=1 Tax=Tsuneonella litorea TaxID=2976475 RepID=A0A9X2W186_9SPHN|nr:YdeI/OmpD-associated family protein [Tsuneonella litorea]MCT2558131.1 YdeI/OmpD-associated family protein [Tsuneonella litorea]
MTTDPRVDAYIANAAPFARPILSHLRTLVHRLVPDAGETIKWGMPCFTYREKNLAGMAAFKAHASFGIHGDGTAPEGMGQFGKLTKAEDLPPETEVKERLTAACARIETTGTAIRKAVGRKSPRPELAVPEDLAAALSPAARATLDGFAPSHRREYLEWILEAKRPDTRARRIAQSAEWLAEGKKRHWKYEGC